LPRSSWLDIGAVSNASDASGKAALFAPAM